MITICLWFDGQAEAAAELYTRVLRDGKIGGKSRYDEAGAEVSGLPKGSTMTVDFEVEGQRFMGLNGGPLFSFTEATSFVVKRDTQEGIDEVWSGLLADGGEPSQCGWLKDRFGVSWQVVPSQLSDYIGGPDAEAAGRAMRAMLGMQKLDIEALRQAYEGEPAVNA
ncbi:MAG: hypothetical protein JWN41_456 [Thermoleophilia bacterium]|nr:hypothetical protein [Thermoleophilia bacterium]